MQQRLKKIKLTCLLFQTSKTDNFKLYFDVTKLKHLNLSFIFRHAYENSTTHCCNEFFAFTFPNVYVEYCVKLY